MYAVTVRGDLAKRGRGTRRRGGIDFSRHPTYLESVPASIKEDEYLEVEKLSAKQWKDLQQQGADVVEPKSKPQGGKQSKDLTDRQQQQASELQQLPQIGAKTAEAIVLAGHDVDSLADASEEQLAALDLPPAQLKSLLAHKQQAQQDESYLSKLKAERIQ